jgi:hypothetical protein
MLTAMLFVLLYCLMGDAQWEIVEVDSKEQLSDSDSSTSNRKTGNNKNASQSKN